jgi:hypothetical protein
MYIVCAVENQETVVAAVATTEAKPKAVADGETTIEQQEAVEPKPGQELSGNCTGP